MEQTRTAFLKPSSFERVFNRVFGFLVGLGIGLKHNHLLQVRGRKSGNLYSTPVEVLDDSGRPFLVCPRGRAQWVLNAEASGRVTLKHGASIREFALRVVPDSEKAPILKNYLDRFKLTVQRYFPIPAGSPPEAFSPYRSHYPVFELIPPPPAPRA
jgi:deazaflavin-dependent oxidoreductase (nitroreductase family)